MTVSLACEPRHFVIAVRDHGPGIAPAEQARLFEPFARLHEGQQEAPNGAGLGLVLVLVRAVAERHGGKVEVQSAAGAGAVFRVVLPLA